MDRGWICPKCERAVAPKHDTCPKCERAAAMTYYPPAQPWPTVVPYNPAAPFTPWYGDVWCGEVKFNTNVCAGGGNLLGTYFHG